MNTHDKLTALIEEATVTYLKHAGKYGKILYDFNRAIEKPIIITTISHFNGNLSLAAKALGISRTTLYKKLVFHNIEPKSE